MHDIAKTIRRAALAGALLAALATAPAAEAGIHTSMTSTGLNVTTDQINATEVLQITGVTNPEGSIATWTVDPLCVANLFDPSNASCSDTNDPDCNVLPGNRRVVHCARTAAGVHVSTQGNDDRIHVGASGADPVFIDAGDGDDEVGADTCASAARRATTRCAWTSRTPTQTTRRIASSSTAAPSTRRR